MHSIACRRQYDPRIREAIHRTQNPRLFPELRIPRTTLDGWLRGDFLRVETSDLLDRSQAELIEEVERLRARVEWLTALVRLLVAILRIAGARLTGARLPDGGRKVRLLRVIDGVEGILGLEVALRVAGLSTTRYHRWQALDRDCGLEDRPSCPRTHPNQLLPEEVRTIRQMVLDRGLRHMPIRTLAFHAERIAAVFAAPRTWMALVKRYGWRRPREMVYQKNTNHAVRAVVPNEYWHLDVTVIRLLDRTKLYLHAVIDNYSRKILAWRLMPRLEPQTTCDVLIEAGRHLGTEETGVLVDKGGENWNGLVDDLEAKLTMLRRILAQVDMASSNSMIERWWMSLRSAGRERTRLRP